MTTSPTIEKVKFEEGKTYEGTGIYGNAQITVLKRTPKMLKISSCFGENRVKISSTNLEKEIIYFKAWVFSA